MNINCTTSLTAMALAACAGASTAQAQSSVQIFGRIDLAADYQKESGKPSRKSVTSDNSRLGMRGSEDLGGGLRAGFHIEQGLNVDTGAIGGFAGSGGPQSFNAGQLGLAGSGGFNAGSAGGWSRQSTVSLSSTQLGEVQLGRNLTPNFLIYFIFDPFLGQNHGNTQDLFRAIVRASNSMTYITPTFAGTQARLQVAASEASGGGRFWNGSIGGAHGPVRWGVGYQTFDAKGATAFNPLLDKFSNVIAGVAYTAGGGLTLRAGYQDNRLDRSTIADTKIIVWSIGGNYAFGPHEIKAAFHKLTNSATPAAGAQKWAAAYFYNFSKRTSVYLSTGQLDNGTASAVRMSPSVLPVVAGDNIRNLALGLRHDF